MLTDIMHGWMVIVRENVYTCVLVLGGVCVPVAWCGHVVPRCLSKPVLCIQQASLSGRNVLTMSLSL